MPKSDSITINLVDLDNIIHLIATKKPAGGAIKIITDANIIILRDKDDMLIGVLNQTNTTGE